MRDSVRQKVQHEIQQIDHMLESFQPLLDVVKVRDPDLIELSALATVLHSFYGGIENIFSTIGKGIDDRVPTGTKWHKDLLVQMARPTDNRSAIVSDHQFRILIRYLSFRHFFRNSYAFQLDWNQVQPLIESISEIWNQLKTSLNSLVDVDDGLAEAPV